MTFPSSAFNIDSDTRPFGASVLNAALKFLSLLMFALPWAPMAAAHLLHDSKDLLNSPAFDLVEESDEVRELFENEELSEDALPEGRYSNSLRDECLNLGNTTSHSFLASRSGLNPTRGPPVLACTPS